MINLITTDINVGIVLLTTCAIIGVFNHFARKE